jgi:hypothetical protein
MKNKEDDFIDEESETFIVDGREYRHSEAWMNMMKLLHSLPIEEQEKMRVEISAEATRELERIKAKMN